MHKMHPQTTSAIAIGIPVKSSQNIFAIRLIAPPPYVTSLPNGKNASPANLKHCKPIGIPMIVIHQTIPAITHESPAAKPPNINHIPYAIASRHCCRLNYGVRGKRYFAVGFPNMAGGYEVRSRYFKGCIPPKSVSLVKANDIPADECLVFEGFMDFLSAVTLGVTGNADCLVLNSVANVEKAAGLLDGYGRIGCFLDRDEAGRRTLAALTMRYGERVTDRSSLYDGCKDLNEYLQLTTKKQKNNHLKIEEQ